ncbi:hypothetical protein G0P98_20045 [Yangia sp. PrR004]|nr:hypothetical protein [Salipiger sp. PrR004]
MNTSVPTGRSRKSLDILQFWHRLEHFIPYDLTKRVEPSDRKRVFWLHEDALPERLAEACAYAPPQGRRITSTHLFIGVFPIAEVEYFARELVPTDEHEITFDDAERGLPDGRSCFARFGLGDGFGVNFDDVEVSTLPWAMGQSRRDGLAALSDAGYHGSQQRLKDAFRHISDSAAAEPAPTLTAKTILDILAALETWAGFDVPRGSCPVACLEINLGKSKSAAGKTSAVTAVDAPAEMSTDDPFDTSDDDDDTSESEIGILNSFFITDLERAMECLQEGGDLGTLRPYLSGAPEEAPVDLYGDAGPEALLSGLKPDLCNRGRWMSPPEHAMSLMQQFAINKSIAMRSSTGIFSVNGPPGTGKTTLLRDIIADNIVARADVLANLERPRNAFEKKTITYVNKQGQNSTVSILKPELRGFGMVVASSNNAAVENISRDLPKAASITAPDDFGYLRSVAHKIAAQKFDGTFEVLSKEDRPWGLIAAALGRNSNRHTFNQRAFIKSEKGAPADQEDGILPQTIWEWRKTYSGPSFSQAAKDFREQSAKVATAVHAAARCAELDILLSKHTLESYVADHRIKVGDETLRVARAQEDLRDAAHSAALLRRDTENLKEEERLLDRQRPAWWVRALGLAASRKHRRRIEENAAQQMELRRRLNKAQTQVEVEHAGRLQLANEALRTARSNLDAAEQTFRDMKAELQELRAQGYDLPSAVAEDLESESVQISGLWHSNHLAEARSELTRLALVLHEAWLAEVSRPRGGFGGNLFAISDLLSGKLDGNPAPIWESLFMLVPVVSTTFASFARQFGDMGPASLGWLFIDEAGQAVPQAAAGALMRARRAVVIGDPLQIEPVFTLPKGLIDALAKLSASTKDGSWSPDRTSVQVLADQTNSFGASIATEGDETIWIGSPLRVHRRCADPMFSLANDIAYQGKMVFGAKSRISEGDIAPHLGPSAWIDVPGSVVGKQTVASQVEFIARLLQAASARSRGLPNLYVISPFKEIATELKDALRELDWGEIGLTKRELSTWLTQRVGTVHTFQGKEEDSVIMVLGADAAHAGAARWAASKPNLLNVAPTRAKKRFYAVGDRRLWAQMSGFDLLARELPVMSAEEALRRVRSSAGTELQRHDSLSRSP